MNFRRGDFVNVDGRGVGVVVGAEDDEGVPRDHLAVWFGQANRQGRPEV